MPAPFIDHHMHNHLRILGLLLRGERLPHATPSRCPFMRALRAFSLVELLVVIAIVGVLVSVLVPALAKARASGRAARELSVAHQLLTAFTVYSNDFNDAVLPGYPPASWVSSGQVTNRAGQPLFGEVAQRYPWRLAPYLGVQLRGLYDDPQLLQAIFDQEPVYQVNGRDADYVVSLFPSFGMNIAFVGGSDRHEQFTTISRRVFGRVALERLADARRPGQVIAFASARSETIALAEGVRSPQGFFRLEPPIYAAEAGRQWDDAYDPNSAFTERNSGHVSLRHGGKGVGAYLDAHAALAGWAEFNDMRTWADQADAPDWGVRPR